MGSYRPPASCDRRLSEGDGISLPALPFPWCPSPAAAAAAAKSFFEAFPRFLRSRAYSHVNPNSGAKALATRVSFGPEERENKKIKIKKGRSTYTMGARILAVTFGPELVTLITSSTDPPPDGA